MHCSNCWVWEVSSGSSTTEFPIASITSTEHHTERWQPMRYGAHQLTLYHDRGYIIPDCSTYNVHDVTIVLLATEELQRGNERISLGILLDCVSGWLIIQSSHTHRHTHTRRCLAGMVVIRNNFGFRKITLEIDFHVALIFFFLHFFQSPRVFQWNGTRERLAGKKCAQPNGKM